MHTPPTKFSTLVRVGFAARAVLYMMLGYIGLRSADYLQQGTDGIFLAIRELPLGMPLLWMMVLGFTFYGLFRLASATLDIEQHGSDKRAIATRAGHAASGLGHLALAFTAYGFATYDSANGSGAQQAAVGLLGLCFFGAAAQQAKEGISGSFMADIAPDAPDVTRGLGTIGYLARAVVFAIIGWSLVEAGWLGGSSAKVKTLGEAVASLSGMDPWFTLVSIGLLLFGLFSLILARFRIIPEVDMRAVRRQTMRW